MNHAGPNRITTPVYRELPGNGLLTVHGTGVFVRSRSELWLVTAAHVLRDDGPFWIPGRPFQRLESTFRFSEGLDLAFLALTHTMQGAVVAQGGFAALPIGALDRSIQGLGSIDCKILGFPEHTIDLDGSNQEIDSAQMHLSTELIHHEQMREMRLNLVNHLAAKVDKLRGPAGENLNDMNFQGLSGGAFLRAKGECACLAGIVTEYDPRRRVIIGVRTHLLLEALCSVDPNLQFELEK